MARYQVDIEKQLGTEYWTNRYLVEAASLDAARDGGLNIVEAERDLHSVQVFFTSYRVRTAVEGDDIYTNVPIAGAGRKAALSSALPLFNVCRVDFSVATGRPSRKYYRFPIYEDQQENGVLGTGYIADVATRLQTLIAEMRDTFGTPIVDPQGQQWITPAVYSPVGMRQLRRGSRRRTTPIL